MAVMQLFLCVVLMPVFAYRPDNSACVQPMGSPVSGTVILGVVSRKVWEQLY